MNIGKACRNFWSNKSEYPTFGSKIRRFHELAYLVPKIHCGSIVDIGCGDGTLLHLLMQTTQLERFYGYDISPKLLKKVDKQVHTKVFDCYNPSELPNTDYALLSGVIQYIDDDMVLSNLFSEIESNVVFVKSPCTEVGKTIYREVSKVGNGYASYYRRLDEVLDIFSRHFTITDVARAYPDEIESEYDSLQYWIRGEL